MKKITLIFGGFLIFFMFSGFTPPTTNLSTVDKTKDKLELVNMGDVLCVKNAGYSRKTFILWYKDEAVSKLSVGGGQSSCFEIGQYEYDFQWKASHGYDGMKKGFYGGTATFY